MHPGPGQKMDELQLKVGCSGGVGGEACSEQVKKSSQHECSDKR